MQRRELIQKNQFRRPDGSSGGHGLGLDGCSGCKRVNGCCSVVKVHAGEELTTLNAAPSKGVQGLNRGRLKASGAQAVGDACASSARAITNEDADLHGVSVAFALDGLAQLDDSWPWRSGVSNLQHTAGEPNQIGAVNVVLWSGARNKGAGMREHSDLRFSLGLWLCKVGPDSGPRFLAEHLPREHTSTFLLDAPCFGRVHVPPASEALIEVLLMYADLRGYFAALLGGKLCAHRRAS